VGEVAAVTAKQYLAQVDQAVDGLLDGCEGAGRRTLAVFHLPVVFEKGHIVGGGIDAQHDAGLVVLERCSHRGASTTSLCSPRSASTATPTAGWASRLIRDILDLAQGCDGALRDIDKMIAVTNGLHAIDSHDAQMWLTAVEAHSI
jgi:hypothetical protein